MDDELVWVPAEGLGAWASPWEPHPPTREELLAHHQLVEAIHASADCLPLRFPTAVATAAAAGELLAARRDALAVALARIHGKTELALTLVWDPLSLRERAGVRAHLRQGAGQEQERGELSPHPNPLPQGEGMSGVPLPQGEGMSGVPLPQGEGTVSVPLSEGVGTRYLTARAEYWQGRAGRQRRGDELAAEVQAALGLPAEDVQARVCPSDAAALSLAALVPRGDAARLRAVLGQPRGGVRAVVNGPWPPYSFVTVE